VGSGRQLLTLNRSIEKNTPKFFLVYRLSTSILAQLLVTPKRHFSFLFPEDGMIDFFVRSLFLGIRPSRNVNKSDIKILDYTPIAMELSGPC